MQIVALLEEQNKVEFSIPLKYYHLQKKNSEKKNSTYSGEMTEFAYNSVINYASTILKINKHSSIITFHLICIPLFLLHVYHFHH